MDQVSWIAYISARLPELWLRTGEHLMLAGISTGMAILIGVPLGILMFRTAWLRSPALGAVGILQTIPSLAMLVFLLTLLQKIGVIPAIAALTLYALLPIVRNTLTGLEEVSPQTVEAAIGVGMTEFQLLRIIRMPLSAPVILAGIRTAAVVGVGIATLSAFIGAGGLGQFINRGLALSNTKLILLGAIPAALLALLVDFSLGAFEWAIRPERRKGGKGSFESFFRPLALAMPLFLVLLCSISYYTRPSPAVMTSSSEGVRNKTIRIATKNFTEQIILGEIMAQLIEAKTDLSVERRFNLGGTMICHGALINEEIDLYAEYTGTGLTAILKHPVISDPEMALQHVTEAYHKQFKIKWLRPFGFNNTYAITVRKSDADHHNWTKISDLLKAAPGLRAGFTAEFGERPDGYPGFRKIYGLNFGEVRDLDPALMYNAIAKGEVDVICAFATDGRIAAYDLLPLEDDRRFFPPYYAAPVIREEVLNDNSGLDKVLLLLEGLIDDATMQRLNFEVDGNKKAPAEVAKSFLRSRGLINKK